MTITSLLEMVNGATTTRLLSIVFVASLKGSVLLLAAWFVTRASRRASAAARHLIWVSALGGLLLMPILAGLLPEVRLSGIPRLSVPAPSPAALPAVNDALTQAQPSAPERSTNSRPAIADRPVSVAGASTRIVHFLPLIWAVGAVLILLRLALGTIRVSSWSRRARPVDDGGWLSLAQRLAGRMHIGRPITLLRSERACVPMTWGVVYPTVLLPLDADAWPPERRAIVLLHELAHVKRMDAFTQLIAQAAIGVFWFNPLVWLAARQMRTERERACDDFVLEGGARASDYAHDLLQIARSLGGSSAPATAALAMARRSEFEGRLLAILDPHTNRRNVSRARLAVATVALAVLTLPLAALAPAAPNQLDDAREAPVPAPAFDAAPAPSLPAQSSTRRRESAHSIVALPFHRELGFDGDLRTLDSTHAVVTPALSFSNLGGLAKQLVASVLPLQVVHGAGAGQNAQQPPPDRETLIAVARAAGKMTSDYEKGQLLMTIAKYYVRDDELRMVYLDAVASMTSDHERSRSLALLLLKDSLSMEAVAQVVKIATSMTSDNDKASLIVKIAAEHPDLTQPLRTALILATSSLRSDFDRGRSISAIARRGGLSTGDLISLINATIAMTSSFDKANALTELAARYPLSEPDVRRAYFKAAETITSPSDYRRAITGVLK